MKKRFKEIKIICQQTSFLSKVKTCANFSCHLQSNSNVINFKMEGKNQLVYRACPPRGGEGSLRWADNLTNSITTLHFSQITALKFKELRLYSANTCPLSYKSSEPLRDWKIVKTQTLRNVLYPVRGTASQ